MPAPQQRRLLLLLKLPFELRELLFRHLFSDSQIIVARDHFETSPNGKETVSYPLSITLLSTCREIRRLRQQALQTFFPTK
jgi:hypothetical protein